MRSPLALALALLPVAGALLLPRLLSKGKRYRLIYYDGRGQIEIVRLVFALGQKLPGRDYDNVRLPISYIGPRDTDYDCPEFNKLQAQGRLACNLDRVPVLECGGFALGQSPAISRFIGRELGLMGRDEAEAAQIDAVVEHVRDIRHAFATFRGSNSWFGEVDGQKASDGRSSDTRVRERRNLRWWLRQLDRCVGDHGFAVGRRASIAIAAALLVVGAVVCVSASDSSDGTAAATGATQPCTRAADCIPLVGAGHSRFCSYYAKDTCVGGSTCSGQCDLCSSCWADSDALGGSSPFDSSDALSDVLSSDALYNNSDAISDALSSSALRSRYPR